MKNKKIIAAVGLAITVGALLTGCTGATTSALCGWVQGNGSSGNDAKVHRTVLPNENANAGAAEVVRYVPCNSRNYIINDGSQKGVNGVVGDSTTPIVAYTKDKTQVAVSLTAYWTLNEGPEGFRNFIQLCQKYNCATDSTDSDQSASNFGTKGWNSLLAENFYPSIRAAVQDVTPTFTNAMWESGGNADQRKTFADAVSADFMKQVAQTTGYNTDLFCGSGNSRFTDSSNKVFDCKAVRFRIDEIAAKDATVQKNLNTQSQSDQIIATNKAKLEQAKALYGDQAPYWLGLRDAAGSCKSGATCQFIVRDLNNN